MVKQTVLFIIFLFLLGCDCEELTLQRENYMGNELRIDGFYATKLYRYDPFITSIYVLYNNGVLFEPGGIEGDNSEDLLDFMSSLKDRDFNSGYGDRTFWGIFIIDGNNILIEKWFPSASCAPEQLKGEITSDTSFILENNNEEYIFYEYSPKPDSTNIFID
jgi:hypothetical protein